jgi:hypothetical protein
VSKALAAVIAGGVGAAWAVVFGYYWWIWMTGAIRLRNRLYAQGHAAGTLRLTLLYGHARSEDPRSPESARLLRGLRGVLIASLLLVGIMIATMIAVSASMQG